MIHLQDSSCFDSYRSRPCYPHYQSFAYSDICFAFIRRLTFHYQMYFSSCENSVKVSRNCSHLYLINLLDHPWLEKHSSYLQMTHSKIWHLQLDLSSSCIAVVLYLILMAVLTPFTRLIISREESLNWMMCDSQALSQKPSWNFTDASFSLSVYGLEYCCYCRHHVVNGLNLSVTIHP